LAPGTLRLLEDEAVPQYLGAKKMSLHQTGFQEVLATATMLGQYPEQLLLIGVQPENIDDFGGSLTPLCQSRIAPAINAALSWLLQRGVQAQARSAPLPATQLLAGAEINRQTYESQRPSSNQACRLGDERVLNSQRYQLQYRPQVLAEDGVISCDVDHRGKY
ncbi:MAG: hydrogenase maturation protease, partial [Cellvibrionaceae bacterium]|nr:hydrogenase maturation protease [Cellvibrionaceae bacterium]